MRFPRKVYALQHNVTGRIYVGSSEDVLKRYQSHMSFLANGKHSNKGLQADYDKYGGTFSLFILDTIEHSSERNLEYAWMEKLRTYDSRIGYNGNDAYFRRVHPRILIENGLPIPNKI